MPCSSLNAVIPRARGFPVGLVEVAAIAATLSQRPQAIEAPARPSARRCAATGRRGRRSRRRSCPGRGRRGGRHRGKHTKARRSISLVSSCRCQAASALDATPLEPARRRATQARRRRWKPAAWNTAPRGWSGEMSRADPRAAGRTTSQAAIVTSQPSASSSASELRRSLRLLAAAAGSKRWRAPCSATRCRAIKPPRRTGAAGDQNRGVGIERRGPRRLAVDHHAARVAGRQGSAIAKG